MVDEGTCALIPATASQVMFARRPNVETGVFGTVGLSVNVIFILAFNDLLLETYSLYTKCHKIDEIFFRYFIFTLLFCYTEKFEFYLTETELGSPLQCYYILRQVFFGLCQMHGRIQGQERGASESVYPLCCHKITVDL